MLFANVHKLHSRIVEIRTQLIRCRVCNVTPSALFYEHHGAHNRLYFYRLDDRGLLFLEQTLHDVSANQRHLGRTGSGKNMTMALKDPKFLKFFFSMLKPNPEYNNPTIKKGLVEPCITGVDVTAYCSQYPFVSLCGSEKNFLLPDDPYSSIGFTDFNESEDTLLYGANQMEEPFCPTYLAYAVNTGKLYHKITKHKHLCGCLGLLHPRLAERLISDVSLQSEGKLEITWKNVKYNLVLL